MQNPTHTHVERVRARVRACAAWRSLYHSIKDVYSPLLGLKAGGKAAPGAVTPQLSELLQQVQAGLGAVVRKGTVRAAGSLLLLQQRSGDIAAGRAARLTGTHHDDGGGDVLYVRRARR